MEEKRKCFAFKVRSAHIGTASRSYDIEHWVFVWALDLVDAMAKLSWFRGWKRDAAIPLAFALSESQELELLEIAQMIRHLTPKEIIKHGFNSRRKKKPEKFIEPIVDQFMRRVLASRSNQLV